MPSITESSDLLVGNQEGLVGLVGVGLVLGTVQIFAPHAVAKRDARVQLSAIKKSVRAITDTRRIIIALVIVGESTPFGADIDVALGQHQAAACADHVTTGMIFVEIRRVLATIRADHPHVQVLAPFIVLLLGHRGLYNLAR